jgi:hypothetical protein
MARGATLRHHTTVGRAVPPASDPSLDITMGVGAFDGRIEGGRRRRGWPVDGCRDR